MSNHAALLAAFVNPDYLKRMRYLGSPSTSYLIKISTSTFVHVASRLH